MESLMKRSTVRPLKKGEFRQNPDGSRSTEITITEKFGDSFANIPSLWMQDGKIVEFSADKAVAAALAICLAVGFAAALPPLPCRGYNAR